MAIKMWQNIRMQIIIPKKTEEDYKTVDSAITRQYTSA